MVKEIKHEDYPVKDFLKNKRLIAILLIIAMLIFVVYAIIPFVSAIFGAAILAFIFRPFDKFLREKDVSSKLSAGIIVVISLILIILPLIFIVNGLINQVGLLPGQIAEFKLIKEKINELTPFEIDITSKEITDQLMPILTNAIRPVFENIINAFVILFLLFFLLYFFVLYYDNFKKLVLEYLPFNKKNNQIVVDKFKTITYATIIGTFFIALIQGGLLAVNFYVLGIPNALFWGFVAAILSFLPIIGPPIIWIPAALIFFLTGSISKGIALVVVGILISTIDNIIRPIINDKYGSIHPLVSILGIYIGIAQFGIIGIFIGPLIVAYLVLFWDLYRKEFWRE
jgi:predicted PurR-regulated permease PerM